MFKIYQIQACFGSVNIRYILFLPYAQFHEQFNHILACLHIGREVQIHDMHILVFFSLFFFKDYESYAILEVKLNFRFFVHRTPKLLNTNLPHRWSNPFNPFFRRRSYHTLRRRRYPHFLCPQLRKSWKGIFVWACLSVCACVTPCF